MEYTWSPWRAGRSGRCHRPPSGVPLVFQALQGRLIGNGASGHDPATVLACCACTTPHWAGSSRSSLARPRPGLRSTCAGPRSRAIRTSATAASTVVWDTLRRYLTWSGLDVRFVSNVTDIEDKIIARAAEEAPPAEEVAAHYEALWLDTMDAAGRRRARPRRRTPPPTCERHGRADRRPVAGVTPTVGGDGIYFAAESLPGYGLLARQDLDSLRSGARVEVGGGGGQAFADRLRVVEVGPARRTALGFAVGAGPAGLAHRMRGDVARPAG